MEGPLSGYAQIFYWEGVLRPRFLCCSRVSHASMIKKRPDCIYSEGRVDSFLFLWLRVCFPFFFFNLFLNVPGLGCSMWDPVP